MKAILKYFGVLIACCTTLCSCIDEPLEKDNLLLKRVVEVAIDGSTTTTTFNYNGVKIKSIDKADSFLEFSYSANLINRVVETNKTTNQVITMDYSYVDGNLEKIAFSDNAIITYKNNNNNSIYYEKWIKNADRKSTRLYYGTLYFDNGNLIKDEKVTDDFAQDLTITETVTNDFDTKNNALQQIVGFNSLLNYALISSINNCVLQTIVYSEKNLKTGQIISSINRIDSKLEYNAKNYPSEINSKKNLFGKSDANHLKSRLYYN